MIVSEHELGLILNPRIRQRTFRLPVRYGKWGERRPCPAKLGSVYRLRAPVPYDRLREEARHQPTCGARVLWLIDQCELPVPSVLITVQSVEFAWTPNPPGSEILVGEKFWVVRFTKGDQSDILDKPRLLAAKPGLPDGDYTTVPSRSLSGAAEEVSVQQHKRYEADSQERYGDTLREQKRRLQLALLEIRKHPCGPFTNAKLRAAEQNVHRIRVDDMYDDASTG